MKLAISTAIAVALGALPSAASQGPGVSSGTASPSAQVAMAIVVGGLPLLLLAVGAIRALLARR